MKSFFAPVLLLSAILIFSLAVCRSLTVETQRWSAPLERADACALRGDWTGAADALQESYRRWSAGQVWLHTLADHGDVDGAEALYRRSLVLVQSREPASFRAELAALESQLALLAEKERITVKNVL